MTHENGLPKSNKNEFNIEGKSTAFRIITFVRFPTDAKDR